MKNIIRSIICLILFNVTILLAQQFQIPLRAVGRVYQSSVDTSSIGTAFVCGNRKAVFTCSHVVVNDNLWFKGFKSNIRHRMKIKHNLPNFDLAYLEWVEGEPIESFKFGDFTKIQSGDKIVYIGWNKLKKSYNVNAAIVVATGTALINFSNKVDFIEFVGEAIPGYSGGPVFNMEGEVIGMIREAWTKKGIKGGKTIKINRAFSTDLLKILDSEIITVSDEINAIERHSSLFELFSE